MPRAATPVVHYSRWPFLPILTAYSEAPIPPLPRAPRGCQRRAQTQSSHLPPPPVLTPLRAQTTLLDTTSMFHIPRSRISTDFQLPFSTFHLPMPAALLPASPQVLPAPDPLHSLPVFFSQPPEGHTSPHFLPISLVLMRTQLAPKPRLTFQPPGAFPFTKFYYSYSHFHIAEHLLIV